MRIAKFLLVIPAGLLGGWGLLHAQKPFKEYPGREYTDFALPEDHATPHEWTRARLMYRDFSGGRRRFGRGAGAWTTDYPAPALWRQTAHAHRCALGGAAGGSG